jgi:signal transduction histidine kinase
MSTIEKVRVLIVDDEPGMRLGAERVLKKAQATLSGLDLQIAFQCELAETGEEAIEKLLAEKFDLLLLDYKLPGISGLEVLEQIKQKAIDVMTIMMTAYASLEAAVSATKNGAFDFLAKPFSKEELESVALKASSALLGARRARQLADEKRRVRFEFISVLAHELKSPLSAVESYLQLMKGHTIGEAVSDYDAVVERSIARIDGMRRLIFDLLDLTRIESGEKSRMVTTVDAAALLRGAVENVALDAAKRNIAISVDAPERIEFFGDASELQIICNNLVSNAVKYNRDNGLVNIDLSLKEDLLTLRVADTGIGIGEEDRARLFSAFSRIRNRKTENIQGSGLGLSILKKLVELYGGTIVLHSEEDVGSTFIATLRNIQPTDSIANGL